MNIRLGFVGVAMLALLPSPTLADEAAELSAIKSEIAAMQKSYDARIHTLEVRLGRAEADARAAKLAAANAKRSLALAQTSPRPPASNPSVQAENTMPAAQPPETPQPETPPPPSAPASINSFNPGIAAVLNGFYVAASRNTKNAKIPGVALGENAGLPPRGFSLGESEVSLAANIDPELSGYLDVSIEDDNSVSLEEAYILTHNLPWGFTLKGGRFLSGIGYINERHSHDWLFSDAPLPYRAFLDSQLGDDGLQVRWLAPTDMFLELGAEILRGDAYPAAGASHAGQGTVTAFVHTGDDINESSSWLAALSYVHSRADNRDTNGHIFNGTDDLGILSLVYKWAPGGNPTVRNLSLTSELFYGQEAGSFDTNPFSQQRWGWYAQGYYQFMPRWSFGLRYAGIATTNPGPLFTGTDLDNFGHGPNAETALLEYDTSEFGRFRLQYTHDQAALKPNDELLLQYTVIYGPHGAHRY